MRKLLTSRWTHFLILSGFLAAALYVRAQDSDPVKSLRFLAFDAYNRALPRPETNFVTIVDIDEASLARPELGQWPWSRDVMAKLVSRLKAMGAKAIAFDMVFAEADRTSPKAVLERMSPEEKTPERIAALQGLPDNDAIFAQAIKDAGNVTMGFIWTSDSGATNREPLLSRPVQITKNSARLKETIPVMERAAISLPELEQAAAGNGCFGVSAEVDGIIRHVPLLFRHISSDDSPVVIYPSLAIEALRVAQDPRMVIKIRDIKPGETGLLDPPYRMKIGQFEVPLDESGQIPVYFSRERSARYVSAHEVISGTLDPAKIRDKIVFVGTSAQGLKDLRASPLDLSIPGVELHMNVVEQILTGKFLLRPKLMDGVELLFLGIVGFAVIVLAPFVGAVTMALLTAAVIGGTAALSWYAFAHQGILVDPVYPGVCLSVLYGAASVLSYIRSESERRHVRQAFGLYISPQFMEELTRDPDKLRLGGETRELSVMFTDIRGFTTISETLSPEALIALMNDFLTPMGDLVMHSRGTIDKFMGDAMMAFWNAPLDDPDHARNACLAALAMDAALAPVNERLAADAAKTGTQPLVLKAGIGINTGPASVGNMGSRRRFAYSALGDTVNLASRLESQTKTYGVTNLIGEATAGKIPDLAVLEIDLLRVKGKTKPVRVYTLVGDADFAMMESFRAWSAAHAGMIAAWRGRQWQEAAALVAQCRKHAAGKLESYYALALERIAAMEKDDPGPDWDGVTVAKAK